MSISSNDSVVTTPTYGGGPGWVWGGGDAGWFYQGTNDQGGSQDSSNLAQTLLAGLQQQSEPPQDWFAQANSAAMASMVAAQTSSSGSVATRTIAQEQFLQSGARTASWQQSAGTTAAANTAPTYTVQARDLTPSDRWANLTQTLYGTRDAAAVAQFKAATGLATLVAGQRITPPDSLSYQRTTVQSASLNTSALSTQPGQWAQAISLESSSVAAYAPQVAFAPNGDGLSVWMQGADLMAATYNKTTGTWSAPITIDGGNAGDPILTHLSSSANGNMLVTWKQGASIYARRYVGGAWDSGPTALSNGLIGGAYYSTGAISDTGKANVVFAGSDGYRWNAVANTFNGSSWQASPVQVDDMGAANDNSVNSSLLPRVAMDAAGNATMAWVQAAQAESTGSLFVSRYSAATGVWSTPSATVLETSAMEVKSFQLACDAQGNGLAVWGQSTSLFAKSYSASTQQWGALQTLSHTATGEFSLAVGVGQGHAQGPSQAIVSYTGTDNAIYAQRFVNGTSAAGSPDLLSNGTLGASRAAQASINAQGQAAVAFMQLDASGAERISTQRYQGGAWQGAQQIQSIGAAPQKPVVAIDASGDIQVLMSVQMDGINSLYARRFEAVGARTYTIPSGATWQSVAQALYGSSNSAIVAALKQALSLPSSANLPAAGTLVHNLPSSLSVNNTVTQQATLNQAALAAINSAAANASTSTVNNSGSSTGVAVFGGGGVPSAASTASGSGLNAALAIMGYGSQPATSAATVRPSPAAPAQTNSTPSATQNAAQSTALQAAIAQSQQQVDAAATVASHAYTARFSAESAANFAQESLRTWNQMRHQHLETHGALDASTGWSESNYQTIVSNVAQTAAQATAAREVHLQAMATAQAAQGSLNTLLNAQAAAAAPAPTAQPSWGGGSGAIPWSPVDLKKVLANWAATSNIAASGTTTGTNGSTSNTASATTTNTGTSTTAASDKASIPSTFPDDQVRISPPRARSLGQWQGIKLVWEDRKDEPQVLMQFMRDYGVDAADIGYATEHSVQTIGQYLRTHGAADGFAGWWGGSGSRGGSYFNPTSNASNAASGTPYATNSHGILISRVPASDTTPLIVPPNERSMGQWRGIRLLWEDRLDEPQVLMQAMRDYGVDAADLAYATGQSVQSIGQYLRANGAADGFANWSDAGGYYNPNTPHSLPEPYYRAVSSTPSTKVPAQVSPVHANTQILTTPPRERPAQQWADIKAVWEDRNDEPYRLMQLMVEFGFDAADIAYASGQSLDAVSVYLSRAGAPMGFAGASIIDRDAVDGAYLVALDQAIKASWVDQVRPGGHSQASAAFDVGAFTHAYMSQNSASAQDFRRLHGMDFSLTHASVSPGRWIQQARGSGGQGFVSVWVPSAIQWQHNEHSRIQAYLGYPRADELERNILRLELADPLNRRLVQHYGQPVVLPQNEMTERMRARYGTELLTQLLQLRQAVHAVSVPINQAQELAMAEGRFMVMRPPIGNFGNDWPAGTLLPQFDVGPFIDWYISQNTPESNLYRDLLARDIANLNDLGGGDFVANSNLWPIDLATPPDMIDASLVHYDPLFGFVTVHENLKIKPDRTGQAIALLAGAVVGYIAAPYLASAIGLGGNVVAIAGFTGAVAYTTTSLILNGNVKFKDVLRAALTSMLVAGFAQATGLDKAGLKLNPDGTVKLVNGLPVVTSYALRAMSVLGMSTFKGLLAELSGGKFRTAFVQGLTDGLAAEVMTALRVEVNARKDLSPTERSAANNFIKALGSAIKIIGNPDEPAYAFATDFLTQVATSMPTLPAQDMPVLPLAFDDEGYLTPGIVNPALPRDQQRAQLFNHLLLQGLSPQEAQNLSQAWFDTGTVAGVSRPDLPGGGAVRGGSTRPPVNRVAFDDEGNLMPGVVDRNAPPLVQVVQLYNQLLQQGLSPQDAQDLTVNYFTTSTPRYNYNNGIPPAPNLRWTDDGWQPIESSGTGLQEGQVANAATVPLPLTLDGLLAAGARLLTAGWEALGALGARALPWLAVASLPGSTEREQIIPLNGNQRLVVFGDNYAVLQQSGADGQWRTTTRGLTLVELPSGQRVALTPEQIAELGRPLTTPNNAQPNTPLINVPLSPRDQPSPVMPGQSTDQNAQPTTTTTPGEPILTWQDLITYQRNSEILGNNLIAGGTPRPASGYEAHHIVPSNAGDSRMQAIRNQLSTWGIDLNSANNGVWLPGANAPAGAPGAYHPRLNNNNYNDAVIDVFSRVTTRDQAIDALHRIGSQLSNDSFPGSRPRP